MSKPTKKIKKTRKQKKKMEEELNLKDLADFPFLVDRETVKYIERSKVMFIMRGLAGSGKSTVAALIAEKYKNAVICSADNYFLHDGEYKFDTEKLSEAHEYCHTLARESCDANKRVIIIDNTNVRRWEMQFYVNLANSHDYPVVIVQPKTPWSFNPIELCKRTKHGVTVEVLERKVGMFERFTPLYWGWILNAPTKKYLTELADKYFSLCINHVTAFSDYMRLQYQGIGEPTFSSCYSREGFATGMLHCTSCFTNRGREPGCFAYFARNAVQQSVGQSFVLCAVGLVITPRTVGVRIKLNDGQLLLWGQDDFERPPSDSHIETENWDSEVVESKASESPAYPSNPRTEKHQLETDDASSLQGKPDKTTDVNAATEMEDEVTTISSEALETIVLDDVDDNKQTSCLDLSGANLQNESDKDLSDKERDKSHANYSNKENQTCRDRPDVTVEDHPGTRSVVISEEETSSRRDTSHSLGVPGSNYTVKHTQELGETPPGDSVDIAPTNNELTNTEEVRDISIEKERSSQSPDVTSSACFDNQTNIDEEDSIDVGIICHSPDICSSSCATESQNEAVERNSSIESSKTDHLSNVAENETDIKSRPACEETELVSLSEVNQSPDVAPSSGLGVVTSYVKDDVPLNSHDDSADKLSAEQTWVCAACSADDAKNSLENIHFDETATSADTHTSRKGAGDETGVALNAEGFGKEGISHTTDRKSTPSFHPTCGFGSRAHITLGCASGYQAVETGFDLTDVIRCETASLDNLEYVAVDGAALRYYGNGRCAVYFNEFLNLGSLFTGGY